MKLRFTLPDLFWLTLGNAGLAAVIGAAFEEFNAGLTVKPSPVPESIETRLVWQTIGGLLFIVVSVVGLLRRKRRK